jgi:luciferase family oxidoreductase group 1
VAETFRLLEALFPNRIDLGMGRAPGGDRQAASVLNPMNQFSEQDFVQQLFDLQNWLNDQYEPGTIGEKVRVMPAPLTVPQQCMLSSSGQSGLFALHFEIGFSFAYFINPIGGPEAVKMYRERFKSSINLQQPEAMIAIFVFCLEHEEKIKQQQAITDYRFIQFEKGRFEPVDYEEVKSVSYSPKELQRIADNRPRVIIGNPQSVKQQLEQLAADYGVNEVMAANIALDFKDRMRSYELLAQLFDLPEKSNAT